MKFRNIVCKLGNMRKAVEWTMYPNNADDIYVTIQCDKRIAQIDLSTGNGLLSDGKGGHQGHHKLMPELGATAVVVPADTLAQLRELAKQGTGKSVTLVG